MKNTSHPEFISGSSFWHMRSRTNPVMSVYSVCNSPPPSTLFAIAQVLAQPDSKNNTQTITIED